MNSLILDTSQKHITHFKRNNEFFIRTNAMIWFDLYHNFVSRHGIRWISHRNIGFCCGNMMQKSNCFDLFSMFPQQSYDKMCRNKIMKYGTRGNIFTRLRLMTYHSNRQQQIATCPQALRLTLTTNKHKISTQLASQFWLCVRENELFMFFDGEIQYHKKLLKI